jgi:drug/metabolite transporter (DMT)-like permease
LALIIALITVTVWGANFSVQKAVFNAIGPAGFLFARYLLVPAAAVALLCYRFGLHWPKVSRADLIRLFVLAQAGHLLHVSMVAYGIHWSTAFSSSLLMACSPITTLLMLRLWGSEKLSQAQIAGVALALCGVIIFLSDKLLAGSWGATGGDAMLLVATLFFSYYTVAGRPLIQRCGSIVVLCYATLLGFIPVLIVSAPQGLALPWASVSPAIWLALLWAVLVSAFLGWLVWGWVNMVRGVARTAPLMYLMPPVAGVVAWLTTDERFTTVKLIGAAITLAGVAWAQLSSTGEVREDPAPLE